jgi:hypothetical protein
MHKDRGNYSSCTCKSSENICSSSGGAQEEKGKTGQNRMKLSLAQQVVHFWVWPSVEGFLGSFFFNLTRFWTKLTKNSGGTGAVFFLDLTENFTKYPENRCPYGLIHLKVIRKDSIDTF